MWNEKVQVGGVHRKVCMTIKHFVDKTIQTMSQLLLELFTLSTCPLHI